MNLDDIVALCAAPGAKWSSVLWRYQKGRDITKNEILDLLKTGDPIPPDLNRMFAEIVSGKFSFARMKPQDAQERLASSARDPTFVHELVREIERWIKHPEARPDDLDSETRAYYDHLARKTTYKNRRRITAYQSALKHVAHGLGMTTRQVQSAITEHRKHKSLQV